MSYGAKYRTEFRDVDENLWRVDFRKRNYAGSVQIVAAGPEPLVFSMPRADKFAPVKGLGATIQLFSEVDRQYVDLYTADHKEWKVDIWKNNQVYMLGYVEPESYTEDFGVAANYEVSILVNNGINVLDREIYINKWGARYKGLATIFQVVLNAVAKMDLALSNIIYASDLRINRMFVPISETVLSKMTVNQDNYIDEDDLVKSCREVLESVLAPESLTLFIVGGDLWLADMEYLKKGSIYVKQAPIGSYVFSQVKKEFTKDIFDLDQTTSSFQLIAGFNNYKINKNRYVKDVIEEVDFDEDFEGDIYSNVIKTYYDNGFKAPIVGHYWLNRLDSFEKYSINQSPLYHLHRTVLAPLTSFNVVAFPGGTKPVKVVDNVEIPYDNDDVSFKNFIFISNPLPDFYPEHGYVLPNLPSLFSLRDVAFQYTEKTPTIFPSSKVKIRLAFSAMIVSYGEVQSDDTVMWYYYNHSPSDEYMIFKHVIGIHFTDGNGNIVYSVTNNGGVTSKELVFNLTPGEHLTYYFIDEINDAGNPQRCMNKPVSINIDIPVELNTLYNLELVFYNEFYRFDKGAEKADFKGTLPFLGIKDIATEIVNSDSGEPIDLKDAELQFFLSDQFKSDSKTDELTTYTAEELFVSDLAGITVGSDYINVATANGISMPNLEMLKGDKIVRQYKDTQVELTITFAESDIPIYTILTMRRDAHWSNKTWMIVAMTHNVRQGQIELILEELK